LPRCRSRKVGAKNLASFAGAAMTDGQNNLAVAVAVGVDFFMLRHALVA
jgi:hypothetical protein